MDATLLGTAVAKISWDSKTQGVKIEKIELKNIFFDPNARSNDDINYIVNEIFFNEKELLNLQKEGYYSKSVKIKELISEKDYKKIKVYDIYEKKGR